MEKEKISREELAELLPQALFTAFNAYKDFLGQEAKEENAKAFKIKQEACKVGLVHIELLLVLIGRLGLKDESTDMRAIIESAQNELDQARKNQNTEE